MHLTIRLSNQTGEFSQVGQDLPNTPYPNNHPDFLAAAWRNFGVPVIGRHFFMFNLSQIPQGATIQCFLHPTSCSTLERSNMYI